MRQNQTEQLGYIKCISVMSDFLTERGGTAPLPKLSPDSGVALLQNVVPPETGPAKKEVTELSFS